MIIRHERSEALVQAGASENAMRKVREYADLLASIERFELV